MKMINLNTLFNGLIDNIDAELKIEDFYFPASGLTNAVKCSHAVVRLPQSYRRLVAIHGPFFLCALYFTDGGGYCNLFDGNMNAPMQSGIKVIIINNLSINEMINQLFCAIPSKGGAISAKYDDFNHHFKYFKLNVDIKEFESLYKPMPPNNNHYEGNGRVFVNGGCLSTKGHWISLIIFHSDAVFFGEEPAGSLQCNDFSLVLILPTTGFALIVPRTTFESCVYAFTRNVPFPIDHKVDLTGAEKINKNNACQKIAQKIIKSKFKIDCYENVK